MYTGRINPTSIQKERSLISTERSLIYIEGSSIPHVYRENDPTPIQKEPSWALNEVTIDWSSEITTEACRQSWVLVRAINPRCCLQAVDIDGFLLKFGVFFICAVNVLSEVCWQHLTGRIQHYQTYFSFKQWGGGKVREGCFFVHTFLVNLITTNQIIKSMYRHSIQDYVVSSRVDAHTFKSIKGLMVASDCKDMSTFVKKALITQCHKITNDLSDELIQQLKANNQ